MNAVITGASRGIGRAIAEVFALHGYDLFLTSRNESILLETINELKRMYPAITIDGKAMDLGKKQQARM